MADEISINGLEVWTHIGVPDEERAQAQKLKITLRFKADMVTEAAAADDIRLTTDYFQVTQVVKEVAAAKPRKLVETLAEELAQEVLSRFHLSKVEIIIEKFILPDTDSISLTIKRRKKKAKPSKPSKPVIRPVTG